MTQDHPEADLRGVDPWGLRRVERLLQAIEGVDSLKLVADGQGGIDEIHVLSSSGLGAKQIVRNIESALLAQFGLQVDHRKISIAQIRKQDLPPATEPAGVARGATPAARRLIMSEFHIERTARQDVRCRVTLADEEASFEGTAEGPDYAKSRLETAAQAVLNALAEATSGQATFTIEGVTQIEIFARKLVVVVVQGFEGRHVVSLPGIAEIADSLEESVVYACLGATNRWIADL